MSITPQIADEEKSFKKSGLIVRKKNSNFPNEK